MKAGIWLFAGSTVSFADLFMNGLFRLYTYKPGLLVNPDKDNHLGVMIAEFLFVPAAYVLMAFLPRHLRFWYTLVVTLLVTSLEVLFLRIDVYAHDGWRIPYTVGLFVLYGITVSTWANRLDRQGYTALNRLLQLATAVGFLVNVVGLPISIILEAVSVRPGWLANQDKDLVLGSFLLEAIPVYLTLLVTSIYRRNRRPGQLALIAGGLFIWMSFLQWRGLLTTRPPWNVGLQALVSTALAWLIGRVDLWFEMQARNRAATR